jgi:hypothetical protein
MKDRQTLATNKYLGSWILCTTLLCVACGRTPLLPPTCAIEVAPPTLDFGEVASAGQVTKHVLVANRGGALCQISGLGLSADSDPWFSISPDAPASFVLKPGESKTIEATFSPARASVPLKRAGALVFASDDPTLPFAKVPLAALIRTQCTLSVSPPKLDFGHVPLDGTAYGLVTVTSTGIDPCDVAGVTLAQGSDPQFSLAPEAVNTFTLAPGAGQSIPLLFHADDLAKPHHRIGQLAFESTDSRQPSVAVPLSADIDIGCELTLSPDNLNFGNVILNTSASASVVLGNDGSDSCNVSGIDLGPDTDRGFTLAAGQVRAFALAPGSTAPISVSFSASESAPPHLKTGTLVLATGNPHMPEASVPLSAYVSTVCIEASEWIYTVDELGMFSRFDPATLTFTDISALACPTYSTPFSMAVDQNAVAWVAYNDGHLFKVDTSTGKCEATSFQVGQFGLFVFGMGFVFEPSTGIDTLYIAGGLANDWTQATLATVSFPSLIVTPVGTVAAGSPELSGTGDGSLWGFMPAEASSSGQATLVQLDPTSGATLKSYSYPTLTRSGDWAMKFWGGSFWIFLGTSVYEVPRATPDVIHTAIASSGRNIVGAGVSTCAPLQ